MRGDRRIGESSILVFFVVYGLTCFGVSSWLCLHTLITATYSKQFTFLSLGKSPPSSALLGHWKIAHLVQAKIKFWAMLFGLVPPALKNNEETFANGLQTRTTKTAEQALDAP